MPNRRRCLPIFFVILLVGATAFAVGSGSKYVAPSLEALTTIKLSASFPAGRVKPETGERTVKLYGVIRDEPTALIFYQGHWSEECVARLSAIQEIAEELKDMGITVRAVTPDLPKFVRATKEAAKLQFPIYSDTILDMSRAVGVAYEIGPDAWKKQRDLLVESTGRDSPQLVAPTVFLIDQMGRIRFIHVDRDLSKRLSAEELLAAAKEFIPAPTKEP